MGMSVDWGLAETSIVGILQGIKFLGTKEKNEREEMNGENKKWCCMTRNLHEACIFWYAYLPTS